MKLFVLVPVFGRHDLTDAVVDQLERENVDVYVYDNRGDYAIKPESRHGYLTTGRNRGWLGACNWGLRHAFKAATPAYSHVLLLNNDVVLSPNFCAGLLATAEETGAGLVGPLQGGNNLGNGQWFEHPARDYRPLAEHFEVPFLHGVALLVSRAAYEACGPFDLAQQPFGWGVDIEYGYLARRAGLKVVCTKRSYLNHLDMQTVLERGFSKEEYTALAREHVRFVFRARYGPHWQDVLGFDYGVAP